MANIKEMKDEKNPYIGELTDNLEEFIENIKCLKETYGYSEGTLQQQYKEAKKAHDDFLAKYSNGKYTQIPSSQNRVYKKLEKRRNRAQRAFDLIPPTYIISLVSLYDSFYAGLIRCIYHAFPEKLQECNKQFLFRDICNLESLLDVKQKIVDSVIEEELRASHSEQLDWLGKFIDVKLLSNPNEWSDFIELTERRNLFVHADGLVSQQYISECKKFNVNFGEVPKGSKLTVSKEYFDNSFKLLYKIAIQLTLLILNKTYLGKYSITSANIDEVIINNVYELISSKLYDTAICISDFTLDKHFTHNSKDRCYIILNKAQAYKWSNNEDECIALLAQEDTTTWNDDLLIPKLVLENKFDEVYEKMRKVGGRSDIVSSDAYRNWPIFQEIRKEEEFVKVYSEIFGEELDGETSIRIVEDPELKTIESSILSD